MERRKILLPAWWKLLGGILLLRVFILFYFQSSSNLINPERAISPFGIIQNDYYMFLGPVDHYFATGSYTLYEGSNEVFAGRMPGYAAPYFLLRLVFPKPVALPLLIICQILLSVVASYILGRLAFTWTGSLLIFYGTVLLYTISTYTSLFDLFTLAESFSVSAIILFVFYLDKSFQSPNKLIFVLLAGFFLGWAIFLRPFLGLMIVFVPLILLVRHIRQSDGSLRTGITRVVLFCLPFVVMESAWVARNYIQKNQWILLEEGLSASYGDFGIYGKAAMGIRTLINAYGGDAAEFRQGSDAWWFHHASDQEAELFAFPSWLMKNEPELRGKLEQIRGGYFQSMDTTLTLQVRTLSNETTAALAYDLARQIKREHPFHFYGWNNLKRLRRFIITNGTYLLPLPRFSDMTLLQKGIKVFYAGLYVGVLLLGFAGLVLSQKSVPPNWIRTVILSLLLSLVIAIVLVGGIIENRYFITMYPWLLIFSLIFGRKLYTTWIS